MNIKSFKESLLKYFLILAFCMKGVHCLTNFRIIRPADAVLLIAGGRGSGYDLSAVNDAAFQTALDSRVACSNCGRKFNPDRIAIHERSCKPKPPRD